MKQKGQAQVLILVGILIIALVASGAYYLGTQRGGVPLVSKASPIPSGETVDTEQSRSANWKTYRNEKFSFEFKHPASWVEKYGLCCLSIIVYAELPNTFDPKNEAASVINTKAEFVQQKSLVDSGKLPPNFEEESRFIKAFKIDEANAVQRFTLSLSGGVYTIKTTLFTDKVRVDISQVLPVKAVNKPLEGHQGVLQMDREKSLIRLDEIKSGKFNNEIEDVVNEHNLVLSTFKFTDQNQATNISLCQKEQSDITALIDRFEQLQIKKDALGVLALFTPPTSNHDIDSYNSFLGKDIGGIIRLYSSAGLNINETSYKIISIPVDNPNGCTIQAEEQTRPSGQIPGQAPEPPWKVSFDVVKQGDVWKIDKYYQTGQTVGKYSAWGSGY